MGICIECEHPFPDHELTYVGIADFDGEAVDQWICDVCRENAELDRAVTDSVSYNSLHPL